jgi:proteasome lid subunit RPN8/RPN11
MAFDVWSVVQPAALDVIHAHVMASKDVEVGGFMIGTHGGEREPPHCVAAIEAHAAVGDLTRLTFTHEAWEDVHRVIEDSHPECSIVGWYHSHPGHGIFLSDHDRFIHHNFFSAPWQIALVVDPVHQTEGLFCWTHGKIELASKREVGGAETRGLSSATDSAFTGRGGLTPDAKRDRLVVQPDAPATLIGEEELEPLPPRVAPPPTAPASPDAHSAASHPGLPAIDVPAPRPPAAGTQAADRTPGAGAIRRVPPPPSASPAPEPRPAPIATSEPWRDSRQDASRPPSSARPRTGYPFAGHVIPLAAGLVAGLAASVAIF